MNANVNAAKDLPSRHRSHKVALRFDINILGTDEKSAEMR
jgi:hypothetical protein